MNRCTIVWASMAMAAGCSHVSLGADALPPVSAPGSVVTKIAGALPTGWTCESEPGKIVVRRIEEPVIVNLCQAEHPKARETWDHWARKHTVNIKYRIVLRFVPKIVPEHVQKMREENRNIQREIDKLGQVPPSGMAWTPEEKERRKKYEKLAKSLNEIPAGYLGNVSVYIEPTELGYARFLSKAIEVESKTAIERVANTLTPYPSKPVRVP
jgi:hypothetical protein